MLRPTTSPHGLGVVGAAVGIVLTAGLQWLRDGRAHRRQLHRELLAAADELTCAVTTLGRLVALPRVPDRRRSSGLGFTLALTRQEERVNAACVTIRRLASDSLAIAAPEVRDAAIDSANFGPPHDSVGETAYDRITDACNNL
jgi:hypothetical protein